MLVFCVKMDGLAFHSAAYTRLETEKNGFFRTEIQQLCHADEPNKGETAAHGYLGPGDMAVRMREVLARPWAISFPGSGFLG